MQHDLIAHALVAAAEAGDACGLARVLHPGVELTVDSGGNVPAPGEALQGASEVGRYLTGVLLEPGTTARVESVNGLPGVMVCRDGAVTGVLGIRVRDRLILEAWFVVNPDKLTHWTCE